MNDEPLYALRSTLYANLPFPPVYTPDPGNGCGNKEKNKTIDHRQLTMVIYRQERCCGMTLEECHCHLTTNKTEIIIVIGEYNSIQ